MSWASPNDVNFDWNSPNRGISRRNGPASGHMDGGGGQGGLIPFTAASPGWGWCSPGRDRPIAVGYCGYPVIMLRPIKGLEFVEEAVTALGSSTELAHHLFRERGGGAGVPES
jgi:hypothetical protein